MVKEFKTYLKDVKGYSDKTISSYIGDIQQFKAIMQDFGCYNDITLKDLNTVYIGQLSALQLTASSRARKISAVKTYFKFLHSMGEISQNVARDMETPKLPKKVIKVMETDEVHNLIGNIVNENKIKRIDIDYFRNLTLLTLMLNTAIRREEVVNIKVKDVNLSQSLILIHGKGDKERIVYFNDNVKYLLSEYIASHRELFKLSCNSEYLFLTQKAEKMNVATVNRIFNKYIDKANLSDKGFTVHTMRKTCATEMYKRSGDIYAVKGMLGHASLETTQRYAKLGEEQKRMAAMAVNL